MSSDRRTMGISEIESPDEGADAVELERQPIGTYLRRQRKLRGISAEELARSTRIPLRSLERLEAGSFDDEVDGFVRGFVRTVAEALGLDPDDTLARMLAEPADEDAPALQLSSRLPGALLALALMGVLAVAVGIVRVVADGEEAAPTAGSEPEHVYRRDPVRALAESEAASAADGAVRAEAEAEPVPTASPDEAIAVDAADVASAPPASE